MMEETALHGILALMSDAAVITHGASIQWCNPSFERVYGWKIAELGSRSLDDVLRVVAADSDNISEGRRRDDSPVRFRRHQYQLDADVWVEIHQAVSELEHAPDPAQVMLHTDHSFRALVEGLRQPVAIHRDGRLLFVNAAFASLLGYELHELVGRPGADLLHPEDRERIAPLVRARPTSAPTTSTPEHRLVAKDGRSVPVDVYSIPVRIADGVVSLSFARDLTERKKIEARLLTVERLASLGRLAASVGHEINNPLTYMMMTLDAMVRGGASTPNDRFAAQLATLCHGAERIRDIVRDLKRFSRDDNETRGPVDLHAVLARCMEMTHHEIRHRARVIRRLDATRAAYGNEGRLEQVFLNLLVNAAQAIPSNAREDHEIVVATRDEGTDRIVVEITDTGDGIAVEDYDRIFEPFFTTKTHGVGTGLGLSISHHIIMMLGGTIELSPAPDRGTRARLSIPAAREKSYAPAVSPSVPSARTTRPAKILIVDDEQQIAMALAESLGGHHVTTAHGGREATELLRTSSFDIIVTDLHMADVSGIDLYEHVRAAHAELVNRMIFMTGGAFTTRSREFLARTSPPLLAKPFELESLVALVEEMLARHARPRD